jgi:hypothetical protein
MRRRLLDRGKRLIEGCAERLRGDDLERLRQRLAALESGIALED